MTTFLFPGSFNPIHIAHVEAVKWALAYGSAGEVWVAVSPQNPLKSADELAPINHRVAMARIAFEGIKNVVVTDFEKDLPAPHYTINSVEYLMQKYPAHKFAILCGSDIVAQLPSWHRTEELQKLVNFVVFDRNIIDISSTELRAGKKSDMIPPRVAKYIKANNLYTDPLQDAKRLYAAGEFGLALNALDNYQSIEADALKEMIYDILAFRNTDIYNP